MEPLTIGLIGGGLLGGFLLRKRIFAATSAAAHDAATSAANLKAAAGASTAAAVQTAAQQVAAPVPSPATVVNTGPVDPAQTAAQQAAVAQALAKGGATAAAANATNQAAASNPDAAQQAQIVLDTPDLIEAMETAANGLSLAEMENIAASSGTSVQNMLAASFLANPGGDPRAIATSAAQVLFAMK